MSKHAPIAAIEVLEDRSAKARCDEGFLRLRRLTVRNRREDGSYSNPYDVDVADRPGLDAVAVLVHRHTESGIEVLTRTNLRPAVYFRKDKKPLIPDDGVYLQVEEIVAGVLELEDKGEAGLLHRAAEEVREEAGFVVRSEDVQKLGGPIFVAPGILSEKIFLTAVDVTGKPQKVPEGDGSPMEEGGALKWWPIHELVSACREGKLKDAKTEIAATRFLAMGKHA